MKGINVVYRVEVLLSTYNGEKYIEKQIESILSQSNVNVHITIRDDGSKDETTRIITEICERVPGKINLIIGDNLGYRKSFLSLLKQAEEADFYAFSDQDDIWMSEKLDRATTVLSLMCSKVKLYASNIAIMDEQLNQIGFNNVATMPRTIESYFTRSRLAGCTFVFSDELKRYAQNFADIDFSPEMMPDHDFVVGACAFTLGEVFIDDKSYIYHIRHDNSVTSGGNGILKRIKVEYQIVFKRKSVRYNVARLLLKEFSNEIPLGNKMFLEQIEQDKDNLKNRYRLLMNSKMKSGLPICDIEQKFKILVGSY